MASTAVTAKAATKAATAKSPAEVYREGLALGELRYQRCQWCSTRFCSVSLLCATCGGPDFVWERSSGRGRIHALPQAVGPDDWQERTAVVELDEGFRVRARLAPTPAHRIWRGAPVRLEVAETGDGSLRPVFRPVAA
ncbi:Zn-ribbon domain-containing OB-fold protein [Streptacidiphilus neutrinimicus]|uniref:Zn-ribbon domain-containing OB-fold protein n=1 Tax=Streptacidiphilus neutrinimicus TaxID=105420 RepID=UPI000693DC53|nr:zinc ribbon domain-containing protein [Streptacidiphilus neutrinimicus]